MNRRLAFALLIAFLTCLIAQPAIAETAPSFAIRAGRVLPVSSELPEVIENGVIIVRDGRIERIGADLDIPADLRLIELPDATIMPGMVAASSTLAGTHRGDESIGAGHYAVDAFDRYRNHASLLAAGITTAHVDPGRHRLLSGQGGVVRLGGPSADRILRPRADLTINLGEAAYGPPDLLELLVPPASDQAIEPPSPQRPTTRLGQVLALKEALERAMGDEPRDSRGEMDIHLLALRRAWNERTPLRIHSDRTIDILTAISFLTAHDRTGYIVGGAEAAAAADELAAAGVPLVYAVPNSFRGAASNLGSDANAIDPNVRDLVKLRGLQLALATSADQPLTDLRLAAAVAQRSGLDAQRILEAITRVPASILGVDDRLGTLDPGKDADFIVLTGHPLETSSHVQRTYVRGRLAYRATDRDAVVVRAGTIWLGPNDYLTGGSVLIENGRIVQVGRHVPHPPHAQVIDAGPDGFVTPGFIDARSHLGLRGDNRAPSPELSLARLIGAPDAPERRVAAAGVTSVVLSPYAASRGGSQVSVVRTAGEARDDRVLRSTAGVYFDLSGEDYASIPGRIKPRLDAAKRYLEKWQKYEKDLAEWEKKQEEGKAAERAAPRVVEEAVVRTEVDPITGVWAGTIFGGPIPEPVSGRVSLKLTGMQFEGFVVESATSVDHRIVGTLDGSSISGQIEVDTGGMGMPTFEGTLEEEDRLTGTISITNISVNFEMTRVERQAEARVVSRSRRTRGKDGRPIPPKVDESLEPLRAVLEKRIPLIVDVRTPPQIAALLDFLQDEYDVPVLLLNADGASTHAEQLRERKIGVVLPIAVIRSVDRRPYHQGDDLSRRGLRIAFQSGAEDGARAMPDVGLYAVERGLSAEDAIAAFTIHPASMFGLEDELGAIAPGRAGDLVIFSGHPFDTDSTIQRVIINGEDLQP